MSEPTSPLPRVRSNRWLRWARIVIYIALGLGILWPHVRNAREAAHRSMCQGHLKQLGGALHEYHATCGSFPPAFVLGPDGRPWHSWRVLILPYLGCQGLYDEYRFDEPWDGPNNRELLAKMPDVFACPSRPQNAKAELLAKFSFGLLGGKGDRSSTANGYTNYAVPFGARCIFRGELPVAIRDIFDGTSNTVLVGECAHARIPWTKPEDIDHALHSKLSDPDGFSSDHDQGCNFVMADGRVRFIKYDLPHATVDDIFTRNDVEFRDSSF